MGLMEPVKLRVLTMKDLDAVTEIDYGLLGTKRREYWEARLESLETSGVPSLIAEVDGKVIGFILGRASGWEYGIPENVAWIDTLGVVKEYQKKGSCTDPFQRDVQYVQEGWVDTIYVFVNWKDWIFCSSLTKWGLKGGNDQSRVKDLKRSNFRLTF